MVWRTLIEKGENGAADGALESLAAMERFCGGVTCRHRGIVSYFGQELESGNCGACDVCLGELNLVDDATLLSQKILSCVLRLEQRFGADYTAKVLSGSAEQRILELGHDKLSTYGLLSDHRATAIREWIEQLVAQGYLAKVGEYNTLELRDAGRVLLKGEGSPQLLRPADRASSERRSRSGAAADSWDGVDRGLFERLRSLRTGLAAERGVPPYVVFGDAALRDMARRRPSSLDSFLNVRGVGERKRDDYGTAFVEAIVEYSSVNGLSMNVGSPDGGAERGESAPTAAGPNASATAAFVHFRGGATVDEVMQRMGRARSTVLGYLVEYLRFEQVMDASPWVESKVARRVEEAIEAVGLTGLRPIFDQLNGEVSYDDIRIVAACVANRDGA
jgi:ATP-dependent DNA helicase RecQ